MALAKCEDCGREVSTEAIACPNCGRPMRETEAQAATPSAAPAAPAMWPPPPQPVVGSQPPKSARKNWFRRHPILSVILALFVIIVIAAAAGASKDKTTAVADTTNTTPAAATTPTTTPPPTPPSPKPSLTGPQEQAIESAQSYLSMGSGFSRAGLIDQLSSSYGEGFPKNVATFAVDHLHVDWYKQAVESAKGYKASGMGFSCSGMIDQLSSAAGEKFTRAEAVYGARKAGVC